MEVLEANLLPEPELARTRMQPCRGGGSCASDRLGPGAARDISWALPAVSRVDPVEMKQKSFQCSKFNAKVAWFIANANERSNKLPDSLCKSTLGLSSFATCCTGVVECRIYKIYLHSIAQYFTRLYTEESICSNHAGLFISAQFSGIKKEKISYFSLALWRKLSFRFAILIVFHQFYGELANINIFLDSLEGPFRLKNIFQERLGERRFVSFHVRALIENSSQWTREICWRKLFQFKLMNFKSFRFINELFSTQVFEVVWEFFAKLLNGSGKIQ